MKTFWYAKTVTAAKSEKCTKHDIERTGGLHKVQEVQFKSKSQMWRRKAGKQCMPQEKEGKSRKD
eukprot:3517580-Amphidinium_carterae.1